MALFCSKAVDYGASFFREEVQGKSHGKERGESPLSITKTPGISWGDGEDLQWLNRTIFLHYLGLGRSKRNGAGMSVCYLL